mgnify:CR=1 FL=1
MFGATVFAGVITALATFGAVVYSNKKSNTQLKEQEEKYMLERKRLFQQSKYVVIKPTLSIMSMLGLLDKLIVQNIYDRVLLYSGEDGFEFIDDEEKRNNQVCRWLTIENKSDIDIKNIKVSTKTILRNMNTDKVVTYTTQNCANFLRGKESIIIRLADQNQYELILSMNKDKVPNILSFECLVEYLTLANQRIKYCYKISISNDRRIEVEKDEIIEITDDADVIPRDSTIFRNLQDYISHIDRAQYSWQKMGESQVMGALTQLNMKNGDNANSCNNNNK